MKTLKAAICAGFMMAAWAAATTAEAADLSDKSVTVLMNYAWALLPAKFTTPAGKVIVVDRAKKAEIMIPLDVAREVIKVARLSAHAQICKLNEKQVENYRTLMRREEAKKDPAWTDQQMLYISQLHLFTVMWLTGNVKLVEKDGEKEVEINVQEQAEKEQTCTDVQKKAIEDQIDAYVKDKT